MSEWFRRNNQNNTRPDEFSTEHGMCPRCGFPFETAFDHAEITRSRTPINCCTNTNCEYFTPAIEKSPLRRIGWIDRSVPPDDET